MSHKFSTPHASTNSTFIDLAPSTPFQNDLTRIFTFAIANEEAQDFAVATFNGLKETCKKVCAPLLAFTYLNLLHDTSQLNNPNSSNN